ncbi:pyridoxamine 5'-phosphate oxidase family protein [Streptomyces mirabilis]|uniref:pyridoxamine 5'-phosphate oxidase family protein n=1 Tax=Streptomyces mirabilis TaxID=68239 RepID=UPI0033A41018
MPTRAQTQEPHTDLDARYSSPGATAPPWAEAVSRLAKAEIFWLSTVRPDGRPHVTPLMSVWLNGALHFATGARERKGLNLAANPHVVLTTGTNAYGEGPDLVVEGDAVRITDEKRLAELAAAWEAKYGPEWRFEVRSGAFDSATAAAAPPSTEEAGDAGLALVFEVAPHTVFGFGRGRSFSQTCYRFTR